MLGLTEIVIIVGYSFMTLLGTFGNVGVLMVILMEKKFDEPTNMLIMNLAIADLLFVLICIPPTSLNLIGNYGLPNMFCKFQIFFSYFSVFVSAYTLVLLAIDRFLAVVVPRCVHYYKTTKNSLIACLSIWLLSVGICNIILPNASLHYSYEDSPANDPSIYCVDNPNMVNQTETKKNVLMFYLNYTIFSYVLPLTIITILYAILLYALHKQSNKYTRSIVNKQWRKNITKTVWIVIATFAICWFPQNIRFFLIAYFYPSNAPLETTISPSTYRVILLIVQTMAYANSCINPLLYCLMLKKYRDSVKHFWRFIKKCICCKSVGIIEIEMEKSKEKSSFGGTMIVAKTRYSTVSRSNSFIDLTNETTLHETRLNLNLNNDMEVKAQFV